MNALFENSYERTRDILKESYRYIQFRRPVLIVLDVILALLALSRLISSIYFRHFDFLFLVYILFYIVVRVVPYYNAVRVTLKRDLEAFGGAPVKIHSAVTEDSIVLSSSSGSRNEFLLTSIRSVVQTKNLILLRTKANLLLTFPKNAFSVGTYEEFLSFLSSKGIRVK